MSESPVPARSSSRSVLKVLVLTLASVSILTWALRQANRSQQSPLVGQPCPPIQAAGWLNVDETPEATSKGQVTVVGAFAWWCGPCLKHSPKDVALFEKFNDRGVRFVSLTAEGEATLDKTKVFLNAARYSWPVGYGAKRSLLALTAGYIPQAWVVDSTNTIIWATGSPGSIDAAIERALSETKPREASERMNSDAVK
jgi:thiol-disulfide isomerase/thioredoxin